MIRPAPAGPLPLPCELMDVLDTLTSREERYSDFDLADDASRTLEEEARV